MKVLLPVLSLLALALANDAVAEKARSVRVRQISGGTFRSSSGGGAVSSQAPSPQVSTFRQGVMAAPSNAQTNPSSGAAARGAQGFSPVHRAPSRSGSSFGRGLAAPRPIRRRIETPSEPAPIPEPGFANPVPGALIRTEGLGAKTSPAEPARLHTVEAGDRIVLEDNKAQVLNPHKGLQIGPKDTLPPPSPGSVSGGASGRNAITPNPSAGDSGGHNRDQGGRPGDPNR